MFCNILATLAHQVHNAHPDELLPVAEEDEADDDVGGDDVQVAEELGQHPRNVAEGTLQGKWQMGRSFWLGTYFCSEGTEQN